MSLPEHKLLEIAADLLDLAREEFCHHGCTDYDPKLNREDALAFAKLAWEANGRPDDEKPTERVHDDWIAMYACAHGLRQLAKARKGK